uniref:Uncharacterized protein AlNc14C153G7576 n=1 Tax=Albugo laibachii Nc14 TaxID=890382 RepID=F0WM73_9STRA|nr:conserved hypothetical protein [Albugo laibachii Nc14]|eukprot:CCA22401.1 conserved hypothetical protein [Albugo laibachii Nc14]
MREVVLRLYRDCLRSARKCPEWQNREMVKAYIKLKFREQQSLRDPRAIKLLLREGNEELDRMQYYHEMYQLKVQNKQHRQDRCLSCNLTYEPIHAKFCAHCGSKRGPTE